MKTQEVQRVPTFKLVPSRMLSISAERASGLTGDSASSASSGGGAGTFVGGGGGGGTFTDGRGGGGGAFPGGGGGTTGPADARLFITIIITHLKLSN